MRYDAEKARQYAAEYRSGKRSSVDGIMLLEGGEITAEHLIGLMGYIVSRGMHHTLQGFYGRLARTLFDEGILSPAGDILEGENE